MPFYLASHTVTFGVYSCLIYYPAFSILTKTKALA